MDLFFVNKFFISFVMAVFTIFSLSVVGNSYSFHEIVQPQCTTKTIFDTASQKSDLKNVYSNKATGLYLSNQDTIKYLYDNFDSYSENQLVLDHFENSTKWLVNGHDATLQLVDEYYGGSGALVLDIYDNVDLFLSKNFEKPVNLSKYENSGFITMWIKIEDDQGIDSINIELEDSLGSIRKYFPLTNSHSSSANTFGDDQDIPDIIYPQGNEKIDKWTDFILAPGWNYLLWRADKYNDEEKIDLSQIKKILLKINFNSNFSRQKIIFDDLRIQDGLQKTSNPTKGFWFPPHGRPQYGVYNIEQISQNPDDYDLRLLNVRNSQYITNGDHARMISSASVPENFAMRVKFTLDQLGMLDKDTVLNFPYSEFFPTEFLRIADSGQRDNTYFRVTYDFEPDWDPGHEWFGAYLSLQYDRFGLVSVWPVVRNLEQNQEPVQGNLLATNSFAPIEGVQYQMDLVVIGQQTTAAIYEVQDDCLVPKSSVGYVFEHPRHGADKRYPLAIESTGNMRTIIHEIELISLEKTNG
ncbi:MAG: hypothetical protein ACE5RN_03310 [Nitrosopumilaceae archaeon]